MGILRFYWQAIKLACRHSLDHTQYVLFVLFVVLGAASYFIPVLTNWQAVMNGWQAATFVLGGIILIRMLLAPYWLYKEKADALAIAAGQEVPDLGKWLALDPLELGHAAWLWCGLIPGGKMGKNQTLLIRFYKLQRAIMDGTLTPDFPAGKLTLFRMERQGAAFGAGAKTDIKIDERTPVRVAELLRYAESIGERPAFLFPNG